MKKWLRWFFCVAINPTITTKRWTVSSSNWFQGRNKNFWFKYNALKYAQIQNNIFVDLENEVKGTSLRIRDDSKNYPYPPQYQRLSKWQESGLKGNIH